MLAGLSPCALLPASPALARLFRGGAGRITEHALIAAIQGSAAYTALINARAPAVAGDGAVGGNNPTYQIVSYQRDIIWLTLRALVEASSTDAANVVLASQYAFSHQNVGGDFNNSAGLTLDEEAVADGFFMSAFGHVFLLMQTSAFWGSVGGTFNSAAPNISASMSWLATKESVLLTEGANATNRLFFYALAFLSNGRTLRNFSTAGLSTQAVGVTFFNTALANQHATGYFVERSGYDTGYQGVSLWKLGEIAFTTSRYDVYVTAITALRKAVDWLVARVGPDGRIDDTGNTRTANDPLDSPEGKIINYWEVALGLLYASVLLGDISLLAVGELVIQYGNTL